MQNFIKVFVAPLVRSRRWRSVCEIGASLGGGTGLLAALPSISLTVIDPCYDCDLVNKFADNPRVHVKRGTSLEVLPHLGDVFDCILIDGDHNWYTVHEELKTIEQRRLLRAGGIVFFHDVTWPWGRRDMYYNLDQIPAEFINKWDLQGIGPGRRESSPNLPTLNYLKKATFEGGARNGVLTAIEDFMREHSGRYSLFVVHTGSGLGVMQYHGNFSDRIAYRALWLKGLFINMMVRAVRLIYPDIRKPLRSGGD